MAVKKTQSGKKASGTADAGEYIYEIHPRIGIARLGPSDEYFLGPEPACEPSDYDQSCKITDDPAKLERWQPRAADEKRLPKYRDKSGKLMRQAVRFRIFKCLRDANGQLTFAQEVHAKQ